MKEDLIFPADPSRVLFLYWGRRGALTRFSHDLWLAARDQARLRPTLSVSTSNERFERFSEIGPDLLPVHTFRKSIGALANLTRLAALRRALATRLEADRIEAVVTLLSHVWTPLVAPIFRKAGVRTYTIVHDADPHPGDPSGVLKAWYERDLARTDRIITLSDTVADKLLARRHVPESRLLRLYHPDFGTGLGERDCAIPERRAGAPLRLLFLGRILPYKGLRLLVEAAELLRRRGAPITLSVYGEGDLGAEAARLQALGANIFNRWLSDEEIDAALASHDALVLSHVEASQSGVAALALGRGLPLIATPVGGLVEQIQDGETGLLAPEASGPALADAICRLSEDGRLYAHIARRIAERREERSMTRFVASLADDIAAARSSPAGSIAGRRAALRARDSVPWHAAPIHP